MKTKLNFAIILFLVSFITSAETVWDGRHTKEKVIKKEFSVNRDALLKIENSYGNVNITTYTGNVVTIEIRIKTNGNNLEKVEDKLKTIDVEFQATSNKVYAKTIFGKKKYNSWWNWGESNTVNMEINYLIKLPITNSVDLDNDYGSINLDRLEGHAKISCDYGKITTKELMADNNSISFDYTNNSYFEYIKSGTINADYSGFTVAKSKQLTIQADYTKSIVEIGEEVIYNCDYGSITIEKANNINGKGDYITARFGEIYKNIEINADYGSIKINRMTENAGNVNINSDYTGITIGYDNDYSFAFDISLSYASLRGADDFEFTTKNTSSSSKYYKGYSKNPQSKNMVKINSDYGSITFKNN